MRREERGQAQNGEMGVEVCCLSTKNSNDKQSATSVSVCCSENHNGEDCDGPALLTL